MALRCTLGAVGVVPRRLGLTVLKTKRSMCTGGDEMLYEEDRQKQDIKSVAFYDEQGHQRHYFYYVDLLVRGAAACMLITVCEVLCVPAGSPILGGYAAEKYCNITQE